MRARELTNVHTRAFTFTRRPNLMHAITYWLAQRVNDPNAGSILRRWSEEYVFEGEGGGRKTLPRLSLSFT